MRKMLALLALPLLGCPKSQPGDAAGPASWKTELVGLLPADTEVAIGIDVASVRDSALAQRLRAYLHALPQYAAVAEGCRPGGQRDADHVIIGVGPKRRAEMIADGLDQATFQPCLEKALAAKAPLESEDYRGHKLYHARATPQHVIAFAGPHRLVVGARDWVTSVLDGAAAHPAVADRLGEVTAATPGFFVYASASGKHGWGSFDVADGISGDAAITLRSEAEAGHLVDRVTRSTSNLFLVAFFKKVSATRAGSVAKLHLEMTTDQLVSFGNTVVRPLLRRKTDLAGPVGIRPTPAGPDGGVL